MRARLGGLSGEVRENRQRNRALIVVARSHACPQSGASMPPRLASDVTIRRRWLPGLNLVDGEAESLQNWWKAADPFPSSPLSVC
jgi:hypothetical protein